MAKIPRHRKQRKQDQRGEKQKQSLQFLFADPLENRITDEYLTEFAGKLKSEHLSRSSIVCLHQGGAPFEAGQAPVLHLSLPDESGDAIREAFAEGYTVLLEPGPLEGQINPNEFFQLKLDAEHGEKVYFEVSFRGKKNQDHAALILPSDAVRYMFTIAGIGANPNTGLIRLVLRKLGFEKREAVIHQNAPFSREPTKRPMFPDRIKLSLAWNTILPLKEARESSLKSFTFLKENPLFRLAFLLTTLAIFIILPILSVDSGLSGDDEKHYQHAAKVFRYFTEDDPAALDDPQYKLNYYGQSFDFFTYLLIRLLHLEDHPYEARHVMVAITGAATILVTGLLVRLFAGYAGGCLALILMFLSPRFLGHSFNNPLDVPFALGYIFTIYHIILFLKKLPRISAGSAIWIALGIGWTNGIRIGGLVLVPYLFMFAGLYLLIHQWPWKFFSADWWRFALKGLVTLVLISVAGYLLSLLTWPYALQDIVNHPIQAFKVMSNIQVSIRVVYDGLVQWSDRLPWHYIPKNVMITVPSIVLLGWMASSLTWLSARREKQGFWYFILWFTILFPVIFIIFRESNVYGGWRHMMFIYPSMLALAAMALMRIFRSSTNRWARYAMILVFVLGLVHPLKHIVKNHPNTYIYFNEVSGGINKTYGKFETDYYTNSLGPATDYFIDQVLPGLEIKPGSPVQVVSNANINYYFRNYKDQVEPFYSRYYDRGKHNWDYAILYCNYIHPFQLNNGLWPPKNTIHEIRVDDVVVAAVVERKNWDDYLGSKLLAEGVLKQDVPMLEEALQYLESAIEYDPNNEAVYLELGNAYSVFLRFDEARNALDSLLKIYPGYDKALNMKGYTYLMEAEVKRDLALVDEAIRFINMALLTNYKFFSGYYNLGLCYGLKNDKDNAVYNLTQAIRYNSKFVAAYEKLAEVYDYFGDNEMAASVREQLNRLR